MLYKGRAKLEARSCEDLGQQRTRGWSIERQDKLVDEIESWLEKKERATDW